MNTLINSIQDNNFIILDFFAGSATTAHAVLDSNKQDNGNRKFILVQLPNPAPKTAKPSKPGTKPSPTSAKSASAG